MLYFSRGDVMEWIRVKDRMPDGDKTVLVFTDYDYETGYSGYIRQASYKDNCWYDLDVYTGDNVTHWAELPELPKERNMEIKVIMREDEDCMIDQIVCEGEVVRTTIMGYDLENALNKAGFGIVKQSLSV